MNAQVRAAALTGYFDIARQLGLDTQPILRKAGLSRAMLNDPDQRIPVSAAMLLLDEAALRTGCQTFGLRMAETRQLSDLGAISLLLTHQTTLREALQTLIRYRHLLNDSLAMLIEEVGKTVIVREEVVTEDTPVSRQAIELAIGTLHRICGTLLGAHWNPFSVNFTHDAPDDLLLHRRVFRCWLKFGCDFNGIVCARADLDYPNPTADPIMAEYARRFIDTLPDNQPASSVLEVRKAIYLLLPIRRAGIEQVAQGLGMNVRTLQRRLEATATVFSDLVNEVRRELVIRYLANPGYSLARIAELLGYTMPSSFTRWFCAQFGKSPSRWRDSMAQAAGKEPTATRGQESAGD